MKGRWTEELVEVLWAYIACPKCWPRKHPTYDTEAMIPVEMDEASFRRQLFNLSLIQESLAVGLDLLNELWDKSKFHETTHKLREVRRYNTKD